MGSPGQSSDMVRALTGREVDTKADTYDACVVSAHNLLMCTLIARAQRVCTELT